MKIWGATRFGVALSIAVPLIAAAGPAGPTPAAARATSPVQLDADLQTLKDETLRLNADLDTAEQSLLYPDESMTSLYVSVKVGGFVLDQITVRINEDEPIVHVYSDSEALALLKDDGWQRLLRKKLDPGTYRLQAEFTGHFFDARPNEPPTKGKVETLFEKGLTDLDLVLPVSRNTRLDKPGLSDVARLESKKRSVRNVWLPQPQKIDGSSADANLGGANDPRYRAALFLKNDGRYLSALTELLEIEQNASDPATLPVSFRMLQAECYLGFGMETRAEQVYQRVAASDRDASAVARASLELVKFQYQRGYLKEAIDSLNRLRPQMPSSDDWRLLMTDVLLAQERYSEAVDMLTDKGRSDDDLPPVLRYNLAVALFKDGRAAEGRKQLNQVGTMDVSTLDMLVLRDKANLTLGYQYLQSQEGQNARTVFGRIRTAGPFSNRALLGLGWAEIAPATAAKEIIPEESAGKNSADSLGTLLRPGYVDPKAGARQDVPAAARPVVGLSPEEQDGLRRALLPWVELAKRDFMDPAVQEGLLGIPWALDRLNAYEESLSRYTDAIAALETARKRMDDAMKSIKGGRMVETIVRRDVDSERGWTWRLRDLPDAPETYFLQALLAEHRFQESIKNYRDARLLARNLDAWKSRLDALSAPGAHSDAALARELKTAHRGWHPAWEGMSLWLSMEHRLGAPGAYDAPLMIASTLPLDLYATAPPARFEGTVEKLKPLRARLEGLKPRITAAASAQSDLLENVSVAELGGQKQVIERYLTEARFAVARIYDRQLKSGK